MERRKLLLGAGLGLAGIVGSKVSAFAKGPTSTAAEPKIDDWHTELTNRIATFAGNGGGTLELGDGVYEISKPLMLPISVSLVMSPNAVIRASEGFEGDAVVVKGGGDKSKFSHTGGWIMGGVIDGNKKPITGIRVEKCSRLEIADITILNCTFKGIHLTKEQSTHENNISRVRIDVDTDTKYAPGSIGIHYERHDNLIYYAHIIGYETGVRTDGNTNVFTGIHVWNNDAKQGPMLYNFYCNGAFCTYNNCYADSPTIAGFYVNKHHNSITQCRIYFSRWAKDNSGVGVLITPEGKHGNYFSNTFFASPEHRLAKAFDGDLEGSTILANTSAYIKGGGTTPGGVVAGFENRISSGEESNPDGSFGHTPLTFGGSGFKLVPQPKAPSAAEGELGEVRWVDDDKNSALWVKTSKGWKKSKLQ